MLTTFTSSALNPTNARRPSRTKSTSLGGPRKSTFFFRGRNSTNCSFLNLRPRFRNTLVTIPIWDFYFDVSEWHIFSARAWTPALVLHLTNQCAKRNVLSLTKPKGKIYKTKSLGNYITISITIQIQIQADSVVSDMTGFINFWLWSFDTRKETQFLKVYANYTMLTPLPRAAHFVVFKISVNGDPKNSTTRLNVRKLNSLFQNPQILRTISSGHDVIHTPALFPIMTYDDCRIPSGRA